MMFWTGLAIFIAGVFTGSTLGVLIMAIMAINKDNHYEARD
jgi:hypothetical protein